MLCLSDSIRHAEPRVQRLLGTGEEAPTRPALVLAVWSLARVLAIHLVASGLAARARRPTSWPRCRQCGACMRRKGLVKRQVLSLVGPLQWPRRVGRCPQGCETPQVAPWDDALGLPPHQRTSGEFQSLGWAFAVLVPLATAATRLGWASGVAVSPRAVWAWGQAAGQRALEHRHAPGPAAAEGHLPPAEPLAAEGAALPLALGADGVRVPCRPAGGHPRGTTAGPEGTVGVVARVGRHRRRPGERVARLPQRRLVAVFGDIEALQGRVWLEALRPGIRSAPQVVWRRDGARGVWCLVAECFTASAMGLFDVYHAAQPLWQGATAWLAGRTRHARRWCSWARHRLRQGKPDGVLADVADALAVEGLPPTARDTVRTVYASRQRHREPIDSAKDKALGLPLGSGMGERACTWLIQQRFTGVGMRWSEDGFNHLLPLRLAWVNGRFEALFGLALSPNL
jgi:hypothetical protein